MKKYIRIPGSLLVSVRGGPDLVEAQSVGDVRDFVVNGGFAWREIDISGADASVDVIDSLKLVLPFPWWCGSGWDSIEDAFAELREAWPSPLCVSVHGLRDLLRIRPQLGLQVAIRFNDISERFDLDGGQLRFVYSADSWN